MYICTQLENAKKHLQKLFDASMDAGLNFLKSHSSDFPFPLPGVSAVHCFCKLLGGLLRNIPECATTQKPLLAKSSSAESRADSDNVEDNKALLHGSTLSSIYRPNTSASSQVLSMSRMQRYGIKMSKKASIVPQELTSTTKIISNLFVFAYVWSFGGCFERIESELSGGALCTEGVDGVAINLDFNQKVARGGITGKEQFDALVYDIFSAKGIDASLPTSPNLIHSYYFNMSTNSFELWADLVPPTQDIVGFMMSTRGSVQLSSGNLHQRQLFSLFYDGFNFDASSVSMLPTVDLVRLAFLFCILCSDPAESVPSVILSGGPGVGKTQFLSHLTKHLSSRKWQSEVVSLVLGKSSAQIFREKQRLAYETEDAFSIVGSHVSGSMEGVAVQAFLQKHLLRQGRNTLSPSKGKSVSEGWSFSGGCCQYCIFMTGSRTS